MSAVDSRPLIAHVVYRFDIGGLENGVVNLLNRLRRELSLTFVIVSHDLAVISYMCDRLAVMRNAQMVETLTREALRAREINSEYTRALVAAS